MARPRFEIQTSEELYMHRLIDDVVFDTDGDENIGEYYIWLGGEDVSYLADTSSPICATDDILDPRGLFAS